MSSCLVVPASSARMLEKARSIATDEVVLDLEDAVAPERKRGALEMALAAVAAGGFAAPVVAVRINAPGTEWADDELTALAGAPGLQSVVIPKVQSAADLEYVERRLGEHPVGIQALIETARGMRDLASITSGSERLHSIVLGYVDLAASLGRSPAGAANLDLWLAAQDTFVTAARAAGIRAVDGPYLAFKDHEGLARSARRAVELGFDAKWAIHPSQLGAIADAFAPSEAEVERALAVLAALERGAAGGDGAVSLDGEMLDEPVRLAALRTLARAKAAK
jgi:citrate lyase subunit beta/citryl-CoA lyase